MKAVGYVRFSSSNQREESITAQKRIISLYAKDNDIELLGFYCDKAKSAKTANRPDFQRLIYDVQHNPKFDTILIHKADRFSRNLVDGVTYKNIIEDCGVKIIFVNERYSDTPSGKMMYNIICSINEYYNANLATEVLKGQMENAYQCKWTGGIPPLGYDIDDEKKMIINEKEAESVKIIFQMTADGFGYGEVIDRLNSLGYKTKKGRDFGKNSLYEIIHNERYKGTYIFNRRSTFNKQNKRNNHKFKDDSNIIRIEGGCPAIVSESLWKRANAVKKSTRTSYTNAKNPYLLTGLLYCGECGAKLHGNTRKNQNGKICSTYRCNSKVMKRNCCSREIKCEVLDNFVLEHFYKLFFNEENIPLITYELNKSFKERAIKNDEYNKAKSNLESLKRERDNLINAIAMMGVNEAISNKIDEYKEKITKTEEYIRAYEKQNVEVVFTEDEIKNKLDDLKEYFANPKNIARTKFVLSQYINRVEVSNDTIKVTYKIMSPPINGGDSSYVEVYFDRNIRRKELINMDFSEAFSVEEFRNPIEKSIGA